ncbi:hypothetical protein H9L39_06114, partial [Fusarium oxysporum f. sp. albedinis]
MAYAKLTQLPTHLRAWYEVATVTHTDADDAARGAGIRTDSEVGEAQQRRRSAAAGRDEHHRSEKAILPCLPRERAKARDHQAKEGGGAQEGERGYEQKRHALVRL